MDSKRRFFDSNINAPKNWNEYLVNEAEKGPKHPQLSNELNNNFMELIEKLGSEDEFANELWYSNDFYLNQIMLNIIDNVDDEIRDQLRRFYIGKIDKTKKPHAMAYNLSPEFEGYLVEFNFALEFGISRLTEVFTAYLLYKVRAKENEELLLKVLFNNISIMWDLGAFDPSFRENLSQPIRSEYNKISHLHYLGSTTFVLGHEIGHHLLKHTEDKGRGIMDSYLSDSIGGGNLDYDYEFAADNFAVDLMMIVKEYKEDEVYITTPLYVMLALALATSDPTLADEEHPSVRDRYLNLLNKMKDYCTPVELNAMKQIFEEIVQGLQDNYKLWRQIWWV